MAGVSHDVLQKLKKASLRQDGDGHEIPVEVREDEEQSLKLQEIIELLVAAGYFRARIKGLSPFDKVVGGMSWCIESCNVELDVDLLFQENSTIGQKIALTEKIVAVLPRLQCPHRIEPHQIQGLDFIHVFPVIQWLVKRSLEHRQENASFVQSYAVSQYRKTFQQRPLQLTSSSSSESPSNQTNRRRMLLERVNTVADVYRPRRCFKMKPDAERPADLDDRVQLTLFEYGHKVGSLRSRASAKIGGGSEDGRKSIEGVIDEESKTEEHFEQLLHNLSGLQENNDINFETFTENERLQLSEHYASLQSEILDGGLKTQNEKKLSIVKHKRQQIEQRIEQSANTKENISTGLSELRKQLSILAAKQAKVKTTLREIESNIQNEPSVKEVEDLVKQNDNLRNQEMKFRESCKQELSNLQNLIQTTKSAKTPEFDSSDNSKELERESVAVKELRLSIAKKNRTIAALQRKLDDVPSRAELAQYQRRFIELYNQVSSKLMETKQYYTLYNTLEDTRIYMHKELSLLNSIAESYPQAMESPAGKDEFLRQLERIVEGVRQSKVRVDMQLSEHQLKRNALSQKLNDLVDLQRQYAGAVKQLGLEFKRHESLLTQQQLN